MSSPSATRMPNRPTVSYLREEYVQIQRGTFADTWAMRCQKGFRATATFVPQHTQKIPFRVELGRGSKFVDGCAGDKVNAHSCPQSPLSAARIGDLAQ